MFTIDHKGGSYLIFNFLVTICCLISSYLYVNIAAHRVEEAGFSSSLSTIFEVVFCCDIIVSSLLTYDKTGNDNIGTERRITFTSTNYLKNRFMKDFIPGQQVTVGFVHLGGGELNYPNDTSKRTMRIFAYPVPIKSSK